MRSGMNVDRLRDWLTSVPQLTREQRRQAFLMLALAEADGDGAGLAPEACPGSTSQRRSRRLAARLRSHPEISATIDKKFSAQTGIK
jgi:hypothetical protein